MILSEMLITNTKAHAPRLQLFLLLNQKGKGKKKYHCNAFSKFLKEGGKP